MKRALCMLTVLSLILLGCPRPPEEEPAPPPEPQMAENSLAPEEEEPREEPVAVEGPVPEGEAFVQFLEAAPYKQWELWPGTAPMYKGTEPHGSFLTTYVNEQARLAIVEGAGEMPAGAIIVKENYTADRKFDSVTAMYKVAEYNPEAGDWFWIKYDLDGQIEADGRVEGCIGCHHRASDNDFLFTGQIGE
jgi:hypothetical protein